MREPRLFNFAQSQAIHSAPCSDPCLVKNSGGDLVSVIRAGGAGQEEHGAVAIRMPEGDEVFLRRDLASQCSLLVSMGEDLSPRDGCFELGSATEVSIEHLACLAWIFSNAVEPKSQTDATEAYLRVYPQLRLGKKVEANAALLSRLDIATCVAAANVASFLGHEPMQKFLVAYLAHRMQEDTFASVATVISGGLLLRGRSGFRRFT